VLAETRYQVRIGPDLRNWNDFTKALSPRMDSPPQYLHLSRRFAADNVKTLDISQKTISPWPSFMWLAQGPHNEAELCNRVS